MNIIRKICLILFIICSTNSFVLADMILLNSGDIIDGDIISITKTELTLKIDSSTTKTYPLDEIESIDGKSVEQVVQTPLPISPTTTQNNSELKIRDTITNTEIEITSLQFILFALFAYVIWAIPLFILSRILLPQWQWMAWVPIANYVLMHRLAELSQWWSLCIFLPFITILPGAAMFQIALIAFYAAFGMRIALMQGKSPFLGICLGLPIVGVGIFWYLALTFPKDIDHDQERNQDETI